MRAAPPPPGLVAVPAVPAPRPRPLRICFAFIGPSFLHLHLFRPLPKVIPPSPRLGSLKTGFIETERGVTDRWVESRTT